MPYSNPITQNELTDLALYNPLHPRDGSPNELYMPQAYFLVPPATQAGPVKWRLFDAAYITTGIIDPNRLGTGSTGAGNLYLADDGTWKPVSGGGGGGVGTLDQVTDLGNVTTNTIDVGGVKSDYFLLDTTATPTLQPGMFGWNDAYGTADLRLKGNNVTLQLGQEILARVVNKTGADLLESDYKVVRVRVASEGGAQGQRLAVVLAQGDNDPDSATTLGVVTENIANNQEGFITILGNVNNINTTGSLQGETWVDGDVLYLSPTTPGGLTKVKPQAPQHTLIVGYVVYAHNNQGKIFVKVDNGYELDELHNVLITSPASGQLLRYNGSVWYNWTPDFLTSVPTLAQVTTAGNTTTNSITLGGLVTIDKTDIKFVNKSNSTTYSIYANRIASDDRIIITSSGTPYGSRLWIDTPNGGSAFSLAVLGTEYLAFGNTGTGTYGFSLYQNQDFVIKTGNTTTSEKLRLTTGGNVLIGTTTNSTYKLDVNGTARVSGNLTVDTNTLFVDAANDRVGIGTTSPIKNLYVEGTGVTQIGVKSITNSGAGGYIAYNDVGSSYEFGMWGSTRGAYGAIEPNNSYLYGSVDLAITTTQNLKFGIGGGVSEKMRIVGLTGNVLIGTTTDAGYKLYVNGEVKSTGRNQASYFDSIDENPSFLLWKSDYSQVWGGLSTRSSAGGVGAGVYDPTIQAASSLGIYFLVNATTTAAFINSSGNFGIGTVSPSTKLHVNGVITATGGTSTDWNTAYSWGNHATAGYLTSQPWVVSGSNIYYSTGNVGIGTSSPAYKLHVVGDIGADHTFTLAADNSSNATASRIKMYSHNNFRGAGTFLSGVDATWFMGTPYTDFSGGFIIGRKAEVSFSSDSATYGNALFTVRSSGNVGIGVTNPSYKLQVDGSFNATNPMINSASTADNVSAMEWRYGTFDTYRLILKQTVTSGVVRWNFSQINNSTAYDNVLVLDRGAVGIGTTNPTLGLLHVEGTVYSTRFQLAQGTDLASGVAGLRVLDNFGGTYQYNNSGPYTGHFTSYHIRDTSATTMFYATSSAFGIGTLTPSHRLEVVGSSFIQAQIRSTDNAAGIKLVPSAGHNYEIQATNDNKFLIYNRSTGTFSFTINSAHNVGIGTLNPAYKLDVEGSSRVYSLRVETNYPSIEIRNTTGPAVVGYVTTRQALIGGSFGNNELTLSSQGNAMPFYVSATNKLKFELTDYLNTGSWNRTAILRDVYPSLIFNSNDTKWGGIAYDYTGGMALWVNASSVDVSATNPVMYITNAGNIGIGTSSATQGRLVIAAPDESTASAISIRQSNDLNFGMDIGLDQTVNGNGYFYSVSSGSKYEFLQFSRTTVPNVFLVGSGGNVGIGTSSPGYKLDISQPNVKVQIRATNENENATLFFGTPFAGTSAPKTAIIAKGMTNWSRADLYFCLNISQASNSVEVSTADAKMVILNEGNVGIGTTTPGYKLEVNGAGRFTGILRADNAIDSYGSVASHRLFTGSSVFAGGIGLSSWTGRGGSDVDIYSVGNIAFQTNDTSVPKMYINTTGNIGIGTTSTNAKLHIFGGTQNWNETIPGQTVGTIHLAPNSNNSDFGNAITFGAIDWNSGGDAQAGIYVKASGAYGTKMYFATTNSFATGSRTRMMINNDGKVAINTTVPAGVLTVNVGNGGTSGTSGVTVYGTGNYLSLEMGIEGGYDGMIRTYGNDLLLYGGHWRTVGTVASEDHNIKFFTTKNGSANWSTAKMILNHDGNLGIGTTNPTYKLQVNGTGGVAIADGGAQLDIVPANYFIGPILSGNGVSISPEGPDRHLRLLTSTSGAASKISIGYFKAGPGWYAALHVDSSETNPPLLLQAQGNNVVIGGTVDSGDKLNVIGTVAATGYKINGNAGWSGTIFIPSNPPGQQNITVEGGLITNFGA